MSRKRWNTSSFLTSNTTQQNALIILNTPLVHDALFQEIWSAASLRICADGGANRLYSRYAKGSLARNSERTGRSTLSDSGSVRNATQVTQDESNQWLPDVIKGDFDSLRPDVRQYYQDRGVQIIHDSDQFSTDLGKCVAHVAELERTLEHEYQLIIVGGLSGRLDQTIHTLHALMQLEQDRAMTWAIGEESIACVLGKGDHELTISPERFGKTCGILPVGQEAYVTTTGLEWDLGPTSYMFPTSLASGVSTSNHLQHETITLTTDAPIVFTAEVRLAEY
ncbi:thiamine pyrophosphokinase [Microbotryomycetes sp. JL201]|nr:thiamine pyrophosphokinase [Microbotryomycetes sp. JL201]